jgi:hypothetical protein
MSDRLIPVQECGIENTGHGCGVYFEYKDTPGLCTRCYHSEQWVLKDPVNHKPRSSGDPSV